MDVQIKAYKGIGCGTTINGKKVFLVGEDESVVAQALETLVRAHWKGEEHFRANKERFQNTLVVSPSAIGL